MTVFFSSPGAADLDGLRDGVMGRSCADAWWSVRFSFLDHRPDQMADNAPTRYEQLADDMSQAIREGLLKAGDRLPSVRQTCQRRGVSPSTVFQAYGLLEARGVIEARPRSG